MDAVEGPDYCNDLDEMVKRPKDEMDDSHKSISAPCICQNCTAVRAADLGQSTFISL